MAETVGRAGLGNSIYRFLTQDEGRPRTYGLVVDRRQQDVGEATLDLRDLAALANDHPGVCAFGKIALLADEGIHTFQINRHGEHGVVFCGNSTAAALACLNGNGELRTALFGMADAPYEVAAQSAGGAIAQTWTLPASRIEERDWRGRRTLALHALNHYVLILGDLPAGICPEAARQELLGPSVGGKLAVISDDEDAATVHFYNSNGRHGAVPQTGIASVALAAREIGWLAQRFADGFLTYIADGEPRRAALPPIVDAEDGRLRLRMPDIEVVLSPLVRDLAA